MKHGGKISLERKKINYTMNEKEYRKTTQRIDVSDLNHILCIDRTRMCAVVEPGVTMKNLYEHTIKEGTIPLVLPEFEHLSVGGLIQGTGLESSSFKYGQFNDTCLEYEFINSKGEVRVANEIKNSDLFYGTSGSFGSLGILTSVIIKLRPAKPYVTVQLHSYSKLGVGIGVMNNLCTKEDDDYIEGIVYNKEKLVIASGSLSYRIGILPLVNLRKWYSPWFVECVENRTKNKNIAFIQLKLEDYLFRHDKGAFWAGMYARWRGVQIGKMKCLRKLLSKYFTTKALWKKLNSKSQSVRERKFVFQDIYVPLTKTEEFVTQINREFAIYPLWLCPMKSTATPQYYSPHYVPNPKEKFMVDVGVWGIPTTFPVPYNGFEKNRRIENIMNSFEAKKMFYGKAYYTETEFDTKYPYFTEYDQLREKYDCDKFKTIKQKILM